MSCKDLSVKYSTRTVNAINSMNSGLTFSSMYPGNYLCSLKSLFFFFKQKTAYEMDGRLEFRRVLFRSGGYVVDTPGLREFGTWGIDPELLAVCFPEFRRFLDQCRFENCRHLAEPGCAVREAAGQGAFDADRLVSYQRLYAEVSVPSWSSDRRRGR